MDHQINDCIGYTFPTSSRWGYTCDKSVTYDSSVVFSEYSGFLHQHFEYKQKSSICSTLHDHQLLFIEK